MGIYKSGQKVDSGVAVQLSFFPDYNSYFIL